MITREDKITQSAQDYVRHQLFDVRGYPTNRIELLDSFPYNTFDGPLDKNYVALGFNFDDGGSQAELGSSMVHKVHTIELYVFGRSSVWGRNLATAVAESLENDGIIPLKDIGGSGEVIDALSILPQGGVRAEAVTVRDPRPFEENVWVVRLKVEDYYDSNIAV